MEQYKSIFKEITGRLGKAKQSDLYGTGRVGELPPFLTAEDIDDELGRFRVRPLDSKTQNEWVFSINGFKASVYDYKGARWSIGGDPRAVIPIQQLF